MESHFGLVFFSAMGLALLSVCGLPVQAGEKTHASDAKLVKLHPPAFPFELDTEMLSGVNSEVEVRLGIRRDGSVESAEVVSSRLRRGDGPFETPGLKQCNELALESARHSEFECRRCRAHVTSYTLVYSFEPGPLLRGCCTSIPTGMADPPELREGPRITRAGNRFKIVGPMMPQFSGFFIRDQTPKEDEKLLNESFEELAYDAAGPENWLESATDITERRDIHRPLTDPLFQDGRCTRGAITPAALGESLRARSNPSVGDLLAKRATAAVASKSPRVGCELAFLAYTWDRDASVPLLRAVGAVEACHRDPLLTAARIETGDPRASVDWVASMKSEVSNSRRWSNAKGEPSTSALSPLWLFPNDPVLAEFASWLFEGRHAPLSPRDDFERIRSPLLTVPAYRRAVIAALKDNTVAGSAARHADRTLLVVTKFVAWFGPGDDDQLVHPGERPIRVKDIVAHLLHGLGGFPDFQLDWEQPTRDRAIARMAEFLRRNGPALHPFPGKISDLVCLEEDVSLE